MLQAGAELFGRGLIIGKEQAIPESFRDAPVYEVDEGVIEAPAATIDALHLHWWKREPVVIRLHVSPAELKAAAAETEERSLWQVGSDFLLQRQRLHFLVWNNNWDLRSGEPVWWWGRKAIALGAKPSDTGDIALPDGTPAFCDGGPARHSATSIAVVPYTAIEHGSLQPLLHPACDAELADDQRAAVEHEYGPARVIASAGSGKTRVLTERLRHVVSGWRLPPKAVCAVAYNTRAAGELSVRTGNTGANIRTLNALSLTIVNGTGGFALSHLESGRRTVANEREVRSILQDLAQV